MTKPVQIRNEVVAREIRELAALRGKPVTRTLGDLVHNELARLKPSSDKDARRQAVDEILARIDALPKVGKPLTDADLYDPDGMPR